jgi:hypothetical protein
LNTQGLYFRIVAYSVYDVTSEMFQTMSTSSNDAREVFNNNNDKKSLIYNKINLGDINPNAKRLCRINVGEA